MKNLVFISLLLILAGEIIRSYTNFYGVFLGTFVMGSGIAIANVLFPAIIKLNFPQKIGLITAAFTTCMAVFAGIGQTLIGYIFDLTSSWTISIVIFILLSLIILFNGEKVTSGGTV
ncbi:MAG: hypothetical protein PHQ49_06525 [Clostridia bacterium]|nr:hypothetical protein [Clostridia bacterium]